MLDGLGGDVLVKGLFVDDEVLGAAGNTRLLRLYRHLGGRPERLEGRFGKRVARDLVEMSWQSFLDIAGRFDGHLNQPALAVLHTRTARAIAPSPLSLFAPEVRPWLPFLHPSVLAVALDINPAAKTEGSLYRQVLLEGAPTVAGLPSTNDGESRPKPRHRRLQAGREAVSWLTASILASESSVGLLCPEFLTRISTDHGDSVPDFETIRVLQAVSLFAQWEKQHDGILSAAAPPWE